MMMRVSSRTRHRVARRLTRAARSTPPNPPQMASKDGSTFFFTSESVNEGHPDKLADQVRDRATCRFGSSLSTRTVAFSPDGIAKNEPRRPRSVASPASLATRLERSADEPSSTRVPTDLRRCPRCLPRPGPRLQGASRSPRARVFARTRPRPKNLRDERARENVAFPPTRRDGSRRPPNALSRRA